VTTPPAQPDASTSGGLGALPSPLDAVDDLRSVARWTIASAGAVGAALISGGPLVAVGKVHGLTNAIIVGVALVVALAGVGLAIWQTSQVLTPFMTTPATLRDPALSGLREIIDAAPENFFGVAASSVDDLLQHRTVAVRLGRMIAAEKNPDRRAILEGNMQRVQANIARTDPYVRWLLALAHVWQVQAALRRARMFTFLGGVIVAAAAVAFFTVTGQQSATSAPKPHATPTTSAPGT
jgi:hypothetical protein